MKRIDLFRLIITATLAMAFLFGSLSTCAEGLLPSLTETVGISMPSLGEALQRYPDSETENEDGSVTELYTNVSETDFNTFSVYLQQQSAELTDYKVERGTLTAEIRAKGTFFSLQYDSKSSEAKVTYPAGTFDERTRNAKAHFDAAQKFLAEGKTDEAVTEVLSIPQYQAYEPVDNLMKADENFAAAVVHGARYAPYREAGNIVTFGACPQTKEGTDQTPIEWIVLDYDEANHKALLLSKYGLDAVSYNNKYTDITWEQCTLRTWLNREFLQKAFSAEEQSSILTTAVDNSSSQGYSNWNTDGGKNTQDQIFLLSYAEANRYLGVTYDDSNNTESCVAPTAYAIEHGAWTSDSYQTADGKPAGWWWLRSPGFKLNIAASVYYDGSHSFNNVSNETGVVRPAFWLNLESDLF